MRALILIAIAAALGGCVTTKTTDAGPDRRVVNVQAGVSDLCRIAERRTFVSTDDAETINGILRENAKIDRACPSRTATRAKSSRG